MWVRTRTVMPYADTACDARCKQRTCYLPAWYTTCSDAGATANSSFLGNSRTRLIADVGDIPAWPL
jgi:hypothetical protein